MSAAAEFRGPGGFLTVDVGGARHGVLRLRPRGAELDALAHVLTRGWFHFSPHAFATDVAAGRTTEIRLGRALPVPDDLDARSAVEWLTADRQRTDEAAWFVVGLTDADGAEHDSIWGRLLTAPEDALQSALSFLSREPNAAAELLPQVNRLLADLIRQADPGPLGDLAALLAAQDVEHHLLGEGGPLGFRMAGEDLEWDCLAEMIDAEWLAVYALLPGSTVDPAVAVARVAEVNAHLQVGALVLEPADARLMYRLATHAGRPEGRSEMIAGLLDRINSDVEICWHACKDLLVTASDTVTAESGTP